MAFRQSKRIKETKQIKLYKNLTTADFAYIFIIGVFAALIAAIPLYAFNKQILGISLLFAIFTTLLFGLYKSKKHGAKLYIVIFRYLKFAKSEKILNKESNSISKIINYSNTYSTEDEAIKALPTKKSGQKFVKFIKIEGRDISNETLEVQSYFLDSMTKALNNINHSIAILKIPVLTDIKPNLNDYEKFNEVVSQSKPEKYSQYYQNILESYEKDIKKGSTRYIDTYYVASIAQSPHDAKNQAASISQDLQRAGLNTRILNFKESIVVMRQILWNVEDHELKEYNENIGIYDIDEIVFEKDTIKIDDNYYSVQGIMTLPPRIDTNYIAKMFNSRSIVVWNLEKMDMSKLIKDLSKGEIRSEISSVDEKNRVLQRQNQIELSNLSELLESVASGEEAVFKSDVKFLSMASSRTRLKHMKQENIKNATTWNAVINNYYYLQKEAFRSIMLGGATDQTDDAYEVISSNIGYSWPFANDYFNDNVYTLLGNINENFGGNKEDLSDPIFFDMRNTKDNRTNRNMFVVGNSGRGKTTFVKKLMLQMLTKGDKVVVIDPQSEWTKFAENVGGQVINFGGKDVISINPLQFRKMWDPQDPNSSKGYQVSNVSILNQNISFFITWLSLLYETIKIDRLQTYIKRALHNMYLKYKFIDKKGNIIIDAPDITLLKDEEYPLMDDFIIELEKVVENLRKENRPDYNNLDKLYQEIKLDFTVGSYAKRFNRHSNLKIKEDLLIFNVAPLLGGGTSDAEKAATFHIIITYIQGLITEQYAKKAITNKISDDDPLKKYKKTYFWLLMDEVHKFFTNKNTDVLDFIASTVKEGRKFDVGTILSTQSPNDFYRTKEVKEIGSIILASMQYSVLFQLNGDQIANIDELYKAGDNQGISPNEKQLLLSGRIGQCLLMVDTNKHLPLQISYNEIEQKYCFDTNHSVETTSK